jgi:hypothetical protein
LEVQHFFINFAALQGDRNRGSICRPVLSCS